MVASSDLNPILNNINSQNAARQVYAVYKATRPYKVWAYEPWVQYQNQLSQAYDAYKPQWDQVLLDIPDGEHRKGKFTETVGHAALNIPDPERRAEKLPQPIRQYFNVLKEGWLNAGAAHIQRKKEMISQLQPVLAGLKRHVADFQTNVQNLRLNPNAVANPHPQNIRFVGSSSQNYTGVAERVIGTLAPSTQAWSNALGSTASLDDAVTQFEKWFLLPPETQGDPEVEFDIVSPVSTPRSNPEAWRKADNANPYVRRIAVFIDDGSPGMSTQCREIQRHFVKQPWQQWQSNSQAYRVDEVLIVKQPTGPEMLQGVTIHDKLRDAFSGMNGFIQQQKQLAAQQGMNPAQLKFDGYISWEAHGTTDLPPVLKAKEAQTQTPCEERFQEGSMDFKMLFGLDIDDPRYNVTKENIKQLEKTYLGEFRYVVQHSGACCSGAAIA